MTGATPAPRPGDLVFRGDRIVLRDGRIPDDVPAGVRTPPLGALDARIDDPRIIGPARHVWEWPEDRELPDGFDALPLRAAFPLLGAELGLVGRAAHLLRWRHEHRFCGRCGTETELGIETKAALCPACGLAAFPRLAPAIIVLVHDDDRAILGRAHRYPEGMFSTLAGFVEPGETLEDTVRREVFEECGVTVGEIRYRGSQHWPFPHSLMVGFRARWISGEPVPSDDELEEVRWFRRDDLPRIPPKESIAHRLITEWAHTE